MDWDAQCPVCFFPLSSTGCPRILIPPEWPCESYNTAVICCGCQTCCVMKEQSVDRTTPSLNDSIMDRDRSLPRIEADLDAYCDCSQNWTVIFSLTLETIPENRFAGNIVMVCNRCKRRQFFIDYMFPSSSADVIPNQQPSGYPLRQGYSLPAGSGGGSMRDNVRTSSLDSNSPHSFSSPTIGFKFEPQIQNNGGYGGMPYPSSMPAIPVMNQPPYQPMPEPNNFYSPYFPNNMQQPPAVNNAPGQSIYPNLIGFGGAPSYPTPPNSYIDPSYDSMDPSRNPNFPQSSYLPYQPTPGGYPYPSPPALPDSQPGGGTMTSLQAYIGQPLQDTDRAMSLWSNFLSENKQLPNTCQHCSDPAYQQTFFNESGLVVYNLCTSCGAKTNWDISSSARSTPKTLIEDLADLQVADHVAWHRPCGIWHHAIVFNIDQNTNKIEVVHYNGGIMRKNGAFASVRREWCHVKLIDRNFYRMDYDPEDVCPRPVTLARAVQRLNEAEYNPFTRNCEHFARWCKTGHSRCIQLERMPMRVLKATDRLKEKLSRQEWFKNAKNAVSLSQTDSKNSRKINAR